MATMTSAVLLVLATAATVFQYNLQPASAEDKIYRGSDESEACPICKRSKSYSEGTETDVYCYFQPWQPDAKGREMIFSCACMYYFTRLSFEWDCQVEYEIPRGPVTCNRATLDKKYAKSLSNGTIVGMECLYVQNYYVWRYAMLGDYA